MASKSGTSHKVVPSSLADDGVLENLIETDGVDDSNEYHEQRMLEDPNGGYVPMTISSNNQREEMEHLIPEDENALFHEQEFVEDPNTSYVTVSIEELQAAGIDIDNISELTEEQIQTLLSISQQNRRAAQHQPAQQHFQEAHHGSYLVPKSESVMTSNFAPTLEHFPGTSEGTAPRTIHQQRTGPQRRLAKQPQPVVSQPVQVPTSSIASAPSTSQPVPEAPPNQITITITDEGHIRLTDAANQTFFFSRENLALQNIDAKNLTDKNIQDIIQMALPSLDVGRNHSAAVPPQKRRRVEPTIPTEEPMFSHIPHQNGAAAQGTSISTAAQPASHRLTPTRGGSTLSQFMPSLQAINYRQQQDSMLLGEEVEVTKNGQTSMAIVRYCRPGAGYKVQYPDGHFEWVSESQITKRSGSSPAQGKARTRATDVTSPFRPPSSQSMGSQIPVGVKKIMTDVVGAAGVGRRVPPPVPGIKLAPALRPSGPPNFYCSVCDKHVCQQEPAYIILRLPACSTCADEKIVILDEDDDETESGREETDSQHENEAPRIEKQSEIRGIRVSTLDEPENPIESSQNTATTHQSEPILSRNMDEHGFPADALTEEVEENHSSQDFGNEQGEIHVAQESQLQRIDTELGHSEHNISHESFLENSDAFIGETLS